MVSIMSMTACTDSFSVMTRAFRQRAEGKPIPTRI
jgi:hypothetical protein